MAEQGWPPPVHPDCASRNRIHPFHQMASPGGAKPGDYCGGVKAADEAPEGGEGR